ncbi:hypothetical protein DRQ32_04155 [bacterium]|nr:MAG: hypothetical protein DRQ32_04155 [bacterium]RLE26506.1 MAG: hypothetical protein DRJ50_00755 [Actinomycetota bacterium]
MTSSGRIPAHAKELIDALDRRGSLDRRETDAEWKRAVLSSVEHAVIELDEVKADVKAMGVDVAAINLAVELLKKDHEHDDADRVKTETLLTEVKKALEDIAKNGCQVYSHHKKLYSKGGRDEAPARMDKPLPPMTLWGLIGSLQKETWVLLVVATIVAFFAFGGADKIAKALGIG